MGLVSLSLSSSECLDIFSSCRKIPRDLTEASLSGAGLSIVAALAMVFLFGMVCFFVPPSVSSVISCSSCWHFFFCQRLLAPKN
jgi:hypothetical protein